MTYLIDKSALVAEIKRRMDENRGKQSLPQYFGMIEEDLNILYLIDTLEVKVDLEKEMSEYFVEHSDEFFSDKYKLFAKHFFELGLNAQKGE